MDYPQSLLIERLRHYKSSHKPAATQAVLATAIGVSVPTIVNFMKGQQTPRRSTTDAVVFFLQKRGQLDLQPEKDDSEPEGEGAGPPPQNSFTVYELAVCIAGVTQAHDLSRTEKEALIKKLLSQP